MVLGVSVDGGHGEGDETGPGSCGGHLPTCAAEVYAGMGLCPSWKRAQSRSGNLEQLLNEACPAKGAKYYLKLGELHN